jgi:hypothetical protein
MRNPNGYDNPLGAYGFTNRDYAGVVATAVAEASVNAPPEELQGVMDVIANRMQDPKNFGARAPGAYGVVTGQYGGWAQFDPWGGVAPGTKQQGSAAANKNLKDALKAALDPAYAETLPESLQSKIASAQAAALDVYANGKARGIAQGATTFSGANVALSANRTKEHAALGLSDALQLGGTNFYGKGFRDVPFDPVTYNGQLAAPQAAEPYFGDVLFGQPSIDPVPIGQVDLAGTVPDLTPASAGFSLPDLPEVTPDYSGITAGTAFDQFPGFSPAPQAPVNVSDMRQGLTEAQAIHNLGLDNQIPSSNVEVRHGSDFYGDDIDAAALAQEMARREADFGIGVEVGHFPGFEPTPGMNYSAVNAFEADPNLAPAGDYSDITAGLYSNDILNGPTEFNGPASYAPVRAFSSQPLGPSQSFSPTDNPWGDTGFHAGFGDGPWGSTPDFSAPSLDAINAMDRTQGSLQSAAAGMGYHSSDLNNEAIAARINAELAPKASAPQLATPSFDMQSAYLGDMADKFGAPQLSTPSVSPQAASVAAAPRSVPQGDFSVPSRAAPRASTLPETSPLPPSKPQEDSFFSSLPSPVDAIKSSLGLGMPDTAFMDAMANPQLAAAYSPGFLDSAWGRGLIGAGTGFLSGGIPGAVLGGAFGGLGWSNAISNQIDDFFGGMLDHAMQGWDGYDFATHGYGAGFNSRGERSPTGPNDSGSATLGDGSYGERSGTNPNNPQGIL